jgi:hypothetical protein
VAPALHAAQEELKKRKLEDNLRSQLASRASPEELIQHNILKADPSSAHAIAGTIQQAQQDLQKRQLEDNLSKRLQDRKTEDELLEKNVLKGEDGILEVLWIGACLTPSTMIAYSSRKCCTFTSCQTAGTVSPAN